MVTLGRREEVPERLRIGWMPCIWKRVASGSRDDDLYRVPASTEGFRELAGLDGCESDS